MKLENVFSRKFKYLSILSLPIFLWWTPIISSCDESEIAAGFIHNNNPTEPTKIIPLPAKEEWVTISLSSNLITPDKRCDPRIDQGPQKEAPKKRKHSQQGFSSSKRLKTDNKMSATEMSGRKWIFEELNKLDIVAATGIHGEDIAVELQRRIEEPVVNKLHKLYISAYEQQPRAGKKWSLEETEKLRKLAQTTTDKDITKALGRTERAIRKKRRSLEIKQYRKKPIQSVKPPKSTLTAEIFASLKYQ
jgi:hypothetical protein